MSRFIFILTVFLMLIDSLEANGPIRIRLVDGPNSYTGRLEVSINGKWGTVCDDNWGMDDADVACRQLGFSGADFIVRSGYYATKGCPIHMSEVACTGLEDRLTDCEYERSTSCLHNEDVNIVCIKPGPIRIRLVDGPNSYTGRLEVSINGKWGTVCDDNWGMDDADVACRQLGFSGADFIVRSGYYATEGCPIHMSEVACTGLDDHLTDCEYERSTSCLHNEDVNIVCIKPDGRYYAEATKYIKIGDTSFAAGLYASAFNQYTTAIDKDSSNFMTYYKRARALLALGKTRNALSDLSKSITLRRDITPAIILKASVLLKQGRMQEAFEYYRRALDLDSQNEEAEEKCEFILQAQIRFFLADHHAAVGQLTESIEIYSELITDIPWDIHLREKRSEVYVEAEDYGEAVTDLRVITKLEPDSTGVFFRMSNIHYTMGRLEDALTDIRECLKLDPDHKQCKPFYSKMKKLSKLLQAAETFMQQQQYDEAEEKLRSALKTEPEEYTHVIHMKTRLCHCKSKAGSPGDTLQAFETIKVCTRVLAKKPDIIDALVDRAEAYIHGGFYEEAVHDYEKVQEASDTRRTRAALEKAENLLEQSKKRDYYKILGLKRNANKAQISEAYHRLALVWHPDKHEDSFKNLAAKKFIDLRDAKEVLTDRGTEVIRCEQRPNIDELCTEKAMRAIFDHGGDPLDPVENWERGG